METINYIGKYDSLELLWKAYPGGGIEGDYALIGEVYYGWDKYKSQWVETTLSEQINNSSEPSVETKDAVNYLGAFDSWADVWRLFPEGGHPGDYLAFDGTNYIWNTSELNWDILSSDANVIEGETPSGTSPGELNYLGHFLSMSDVWYFFPEGGQPGDFVQVSDIFYVWDTISQNWQNSKTTIYVNYDFAGRAIEASKTRTTINYLGSFAELNDVWIVYPEGGHEGDYIHLAEEIQVWNKYRNNWGDYETPQTPAIKTDVVDGTLKVVQDLIVGGKLIAKDIDIDINQLKLFTLTFLLQNGDITYNPKLADKTVDLRNFASNEDLTKLKVELSKAIEDLDIDTLKSILSLFTPIYDDAKKLKQIQPNAPLGVDEISSKTFAPGIFGSGFQLSQRADGTSLLTVDSAIIRRSLTVFELIIQQLKHQGGIVFYTAASMEVSAVERVTGGWKCYFDTKNGQVPNQFVVDDQARCQRFNVGTTSSKYYWRLVTAVGLDYIVLSDTDCDEGSDIPEVADTIVQLGNRSNVDNSRKAAIVISSYGDNSPSIMMYTGIDSYSLQGKEIHGTIYRNNNGEYEAYFYNYGSMRLGAREGEDGGYITYDHKTKQLNINAVVNFLPQSTGLEQMESYQKLVKIAQGNIETWFYDGVSPIQSGAPTMSNYPVNTWEADDYENHIGDIYYSNTGKGYRFKRSGSTWGWEIISDTELAQLMADVQSLQYLKDALSDGTTTVAGGLILTSLIQLGYEDAENVRHTMAGISGLGQNSTAPAAWYGGPMVDHELNPDATEFAKSLFRFNGTGYLASGNITWDEKGYGQIGGEGDNYALKWNDKEVRIGPNIKLGAGDETIAMLANLLNMFELDTTSVAGKTLIHAKYDGLYSDGDIAAGGAFAGTPSGGGKTYLNELLDVQLATSSLNVGDMLMWNGAKYVNIPQSSITPDLSEYATKQWVLDKKYLTSVPVTSVVGQTGNITTAQVATALTDAGYKLTDTTYELATTTSNGLMSATDKTKLDGIAANANNYTLPTASSSTKGGIRVGATLSISGEVLDLKSGFPKGTYTKVQIDDYGRVVSGSTLSASDIPNLSWSKITTGKPTTISGYGITDAYTKTETDSKVAALQSLLDSMFERVYDSNNKLIRVHSNVTISSSGDLVAGGNSGGGGTSGGGKTYLNELLDVQLATSSLSEGDMLMWNGAKYVNIPQSSITPDLSAYATQQWVLDKKYLTSVPVTSVVGQTGNITAAQVATALTDAGYKLTDTTYGLATTTSNGLMSATDKTKLDGIAANANNYTLPTASSSTKGGIKVGTTLSISGEVLDLKSGFPKGTYTKVQIDDYGRVSSGSTLSASDIPSLPWSKITTGKPTTISGYGITDAYTKTETDNKVAALQSLLDSMFERVYDSNNKLIRIHSNVTISSSGDLVAGGNSEGGGTSGGAYTQLEWNAIKALTQSESGLLASAYAVKEAYNELNTAIETLAGKATNVKFTQTLTSGKQIGSISIDGKSTSLFAPANYAWSEVTDRPTKLSQFTDDVVSGKYLPLSGGTMSNTNVVTNLNADLLDGYHKDDLLRKTVSPTSVISLNNVVAGGIDFTSWDFAHSANVNNQPFGDGASSAASVVSFGTAYPFQIYSDFKNTNNLFYRSYYYETGWSAWRQFAFTDSNVASATKWANARTITLTGSVTGSVSIDGSANVSLATTTNHTHTFDSLTSKPTTISGYGITDAYTKTQTDTKLSGYLPLTGGTLYSNSSSIVLNLKAPGSAVDSIIRFSDATTSEIYEILLRRPTTSFGLQCNINGNYYNLIHSGNYNSYAPKLDGTGASGTWGISISGNAASATNADKLDGFHADSFTKKLYLGTTDLDSIGDSLLGQQYGNANATTELHYPVEEAGGLISILSTYNSTNQIYGTYRTNRWFARGAGTGLSSRTSWREFAFTDSNVASATKLQNSRTIWGQSFDGTGNVDGSLTGKNFLLMDRASNPYLRLTDSYGNVYFQIVNGDAYIGSTSSKSLMVDGEGNVGIGTTSPSYKLHIVGDGYCTGNFISAGDVTAGSDIRYKDKIQDLRLSVHDIALAPAFTYKWNNRNDALIHIGSSAQYWLNTNAKDAVYYDKQNDFYHLNYASLALCNTIILARGMETQEEKIARLEERINELEDKIRQYDSCR